MSAPERPFPIEPLMAKVPNIHALGAHVARDLHRLKHQGALSEAQADKWAVRLGYHPAEIWPSWLDQ